MGSKRHDVIVIGAGHNGLVCGTRLAKAGLDTLILERRPIVGGACVTEEVWPGYHVSTASYVLSMFHPKIIEELGLKRFGFDLIPTDILFVPFEDGRYMVLWDDVGSTCEEIAKFSAADAERYPEYEEFLQKAARLVRDLMWRTPPTSFGPRPAMEGASLLWRLQRMGHDAFGFVDLMTLSVSEFLDRWFESDQLKATLAYYGSIGTFKVPFLPQQASSFLPPLARRERVGVRGS
ncbi:MAG: NAD(P)/FAD-dependent oxidoreductase, partial [Actinobacteria bacterium]|nr:NAD(P)/FAD-dependent oxidoreductase [Actinomycetota bacterium]